MMVDFIDYSRYAAAFPEVWAAAASPGASPDAVEGLW